MLYLVCGVIIGLVMGLTGAGGALIAIPLFMQLLGMNLKEASVYSLVSVVIASLINFIPHRKLAQYNTASLIIFASAFGSYISAPYKEMLPTIYITLVLSFISLYALYTVWYPVKVSTETYTNKSIGITIIIGLGLGFLTTFTGLGGGVMMLPIFLGLFRYTYPQGLATSLFAVGLSSLISLIIQFSFGVKLGAKGDLLFLVLGILVSVFVLKIFLARMTPVIVSRSRQLIFTIVVILAFIKIF